MHLFNVVTLFFILVLVGAELSVSAFINPAASQLGPDPQATLLSYVAARLGAVMPVWYALALLLLGTEAWLGRHTAQFAVLLTAAVLWLVVILASLRFLVPLNNLVIKGAPGWQRAQQTWDRRHRLRIVLLAVASLLLAYALVA